MKNPLLKRLPREFKSDLAKYLILFVFLTSVIGFVSGFLVASNSMMASYNESFEKYNVEDGNFELSAAASDQLLTELEEEPVRIAENFYIEQETKNFDSDLRIFKIRKDMNKACLMDGSLPENANEIAIDRMYADNNGLGVGDVISLEARDLTISGLVALSDYSALYQSTSDMMFDATRFGVGVVTENTFTELGTDHLHYNYSWQYETTPGDKTEEKEMSEDLLDALNLAILKKSATTNSYHPSFPTNAVVGFLPQYVNQAIVFVGNDMGRDSAMFTYFLYIVICIIAFIFAITTSNTITTEASVIGTLRASGYTKGELIRHYMTMPVLVTLISALLGNILGYTLFKEVAVNIYYMSYSLPTYVTLWNGDAFMKTTLIPVLIMIAINFFILLNKMNLSPLNFLRRDLTRKQKKKAMKLNEKRGIMGRFRTRVILQNMPNYITIVVGIFLANIIMLFGIALPALLDKYQEEIQNNMICDYQYVLKAPIETDTEGAEKYSACSLKTIEGKLKSEDVTVFGIQDGSAYVEIPFAPDNVSTEHSILSDDASKNANAMEKVHVSNALSEKFGIDAGDTLTVKDEFAEKEYSFLVDGVYYYPAGIAIFMPQNDFNKTFDYPEGSYNGYFSDVEIEDIPTAYIASTITEEDLTKTSRQMDASLGSVMDLFGVFGVIMFMLIIFLLSKIVIEKNAQSISMTKILGYNDKEISGLYIASTSIVVIASLILTLPIVDILLGYVVVLIMSEYAGYLPYYVPADAYFKVILAGILSYAVIAFIQFRKVKSIPLDIALKNRE